MKKHLSFKNASRNTITVLLKEFEKLGNPFVCQSDENDLIKLNTRDILWQEVIKSINEIEELSLLQADKFISE